MNRLLNRLRETAWWKLYRCSWWVKNRLNHLLPLCHNNKRSISWLNVALKCRNSPLKGQNIHLFLLWHECLFDTIRLNLQLCFCTPYLHQKMSSLLCYDSFSKYCFFSHSAAGGQDSRNENINQSAHRDTAGSLLPLKHSLDGTKQRKHFFPPFFWW